MPIYDYKCPQCENVESRLVNTSMKDQQLCTCGKKTPMRKLESYAPSLLKFNGKWYSNGKEY